MQVSVLTLELYKAINDLTLLSKGAIRVAEVENILKDKGYPLKTIRSEIERFFYGFESIESYKNGQHFLELTDLGIDYLNNIVQSVQDQSSSFAIILRNSKRKDSLNAILQESTFFNNRIYDLIARYQFRNGSARDFLKCIEIDTLLDFLDCILSSLKISQDNALPTVDNCIDSVNENGKFWGTLASKYSWIFFNQQYYLDLNSLQWKLYAEIMSLLKRPVEWGGNAKDLPIKEAEDNYSISDINNLRANGILRPIYENGQASAYRLTAPGFLMWERKERGFLLEIRIQRVDEDAYTVFFSNASDKADYYIYPRDTYCENMSGKKEEVLMYLKREFLRYKSRGGIL